MEDASVINEKVAAASAVVDGGTKEEGRAYYSQESKTGQEFLQQLQQKVAVHNTTASWKGASLETPACDNNISPLPDGVALSRQNPIVSGTPGAYAVQPTVMISNNNNDDAMLSSPDVIAINNDESPNSPQREEEALAEARPVQMDAESQETIEAMPVLEGSNQSPHQKGNLTMCSHKWKVLLLVLPAGLLMVAGIVVLGTMCIYDRCAAAKEEGATSTETPQALEANEAANIRQGIQSFLGNDYFTSVQGGTRQQALEWILYQDPLQINSTESTMRLLQRYIVVLLYYQTTQQMLWLECNPDLHSSKWCYPPEEFGTSFYDQSKIWGYRWLSEAHECQWAGISCSGSGDDERIITELKLSFNNLNGPIPWELSKLTGLLRLELDHNKLTGTVPTYLGELSTLSVLRLNGNQLEGSIPPELLRGASHGNVTPGDSTRYDLSENLLTGPIPTQIGHFRNAQLAMTDNMLSGTLPMEFFKLNKLLLLEIGGNSHIQGTLPSQVGQMASLQYLEAGDTALSGTIPSEIGLLGLSYLMIDHTNLEGLIPTEMFGVSELRWLDISGCNFSGTISSSLGRLTSLQAFLFANNQFSGTIPMEIGELSRLETISINGNNLVSGSVPEYICQLKDPSKTKWKLSADCLPQSTTSGGAPLMSCPEQCCTSCCDPLTGFCEAA